MSATTTDIFTAEGADDRPNAYYEGATAVIRASAAGGSSHVIAASLAGITPLEHTARTRQYMAEGVLHEPAILARVAEDGWLMESVGAEQAELDIPVTSRILVRCHPDGFATAREDMVVGDVVRGERFVVEAKAMSRGVFETYERKGFDEFYRYAVQLSLQMEGTGLPGLFAIKNRDNGEVRWQVFRNPPVAMAQIRKRLLLIERGARLGDLNPLKEKCESFPCVMYFLHDHEVGETVEDETIDSLAEMVARARERKQQAEEMEKEARGKLREYLGEAGKRRTKTWSVAYREQEGRVTYDTKKMAEDGVDVQAYARKGKGYAVVTVKRLGKTGDGDGDEGGA